MEERIFRPRQISGAITPPGDKSISHRAVIFNAIAGGTAVIENYCPGEDGLSTLGVLRELGFSINRHGTDVRVDGGLLTEPKRALDVGNSGTTMRLMAGFLAGQNFRSCLTGDKSIQTRPMGRIIEPLRLMGAEIDGVQGSQMAPLSINGGGLRGIHYRLPMPSAQVKSALLLAGLFAEGDTVIDQPSLSRDHTERLFGAMGAPVKADGLRLTLKSKSLQPTDVKVPADISSAAYWLVTAICHQDAEIRVEGVGLNPSRTGILDVLWDMGADISIERSYMTGGEQIGDLVARSSQLKGVDILGDLIPRLIDEIPIIALAACFAEGETTIRDAGELRLKESDRIVSTGMELGRLGADIDELEDGFIIRGKRYLQGADCYSHRDHRIAMMLGVAGLISKGTTVVSNAEYASVSYPGFWFDLNYLVSGARE